ncbi:peptidylprolyl isomerase [Roseibacterium beibuensis]|uniref:peptidylprolyl isomerase n=1 Tax=[Roseibacterium] beibuensis TaxID=1193142 RepID=UPI00217DC5E1|nr:peptidylprolyl isomerase [Roseibacterium beibuensis]MCS6624837.1 peptidylprolyl isomerase [Roseibacterium beibuensis]
MKIATAAALAVSLLAAAPAVAQTADWRTVAPENLLVIDTVHGRILVEMDPRVAPNAVNRIRTLADQGFYDGLKFHRVIPNFMAQTGDPQGTGQGGSELPDLAGEFEFRRGRDAGFIRVAQTPQGQAGLIGSVPVTTQPDAQMMITADFKTGAQGLFCPGVAGMARGAALDSANSQFFLMTGPKDDLNGRYTPFGRVVAGMEAVRALKAGTEADNGAVADPDVMSRARTAAALPEGERPTVRVATGAAVQAEIERVRAERGAAFDVCDVQPPAEVVGG